MSCGSEFFTSNCVCDTLLAIVKAQDKVNPIREDDDCEFGCERAIHELVEGVQNNMNDTIPVILVCKSTCEPFKAVGVKRSGSNSHPFEVVTGCVFRVVDVDPDTCCATLEILKKVKSSGGSGSKHEHDDDTFDCVKDLEKAHKLKRTGVCITIDLNCFCGVSCVFPQNLFD
ncbi:hypothetical protein AM500_20115 [Bacillus sp. FJAT-18017]|uniref:CotY/CotZ family spore coat protein n=1 Tax=unclassified Bacillus (in: firmicutes) TaxID=185979 RepID=UPI0005C7A0AD|nr:MULTISPECIES: CotY/CotZ family spore coat protein [unclassified Bacillus (in: firmicutes)]ALC91834.1 hypothetical protein AM500_20115 [Bacillus sp. FJAT-18017]